MTPPVALRYHLWVQHFREPWVLVRWLGGRWSLPWVEVSADRHHVSVIEDTLRVLGIRGTLRITGGALVEPLHRRVAWVCLVGAHEADAPSGWRWLDTGSLHRHEPCSEMDAHAGATVDSWLNGRQLCAALQARWLDELTEWVSSAVGTSIDMKSVRVIRSSLSRQVVSVSAHTGQRWYCKCVALSDCREAVLVQALHARWPLHFPEVVALDTACGRWLERDCGEVLAGQRRIPSPCIVGVVDTLARIQREVYDDWARFALLCEGDYGPAAVRRVGHELLDRARAADFVTDETADAARSLLDGLSQRVARSQQSVTWMHTDLHSGNVVALDTVVFLDHARSGCGPAPVPAYAFLSRLVRQGRAEREVLASLQRAYDVDDRLISDLDPWAKLTQLAIAFDTTQHAIATGDISTPMDRLLPWSGRDVAEVLTSVPAH